MSKPSSYPSYSNQDVEIIEQETLYQGFFKMVKYRFRHKLFEGGWSDIVQRELLERGHAVAVLPYDPVADKVIMVEQIRWEP
ncbi:ADP-ribose pyrophosphatase [Vibrio sp. JCM 19236]|nr:ADP-ribose pyrophosphatase [Vibrio sp. JCM 19236]